MHDVVPPESLTTPRLVLRRPVESDAIAMFDGWAGNPQVTKYLSWAPHGSVDASIERIRRCLDGWSRRTDFTWFIEERSSAAPVGAIVARHGHGISLGYVLSPSASGRGVMTEAVTAVTEWWLSEGGAHRVWATCDVENAPSARVLQRSGFRLEGRLRNWAPHLNVGPEPRDALCFSRVRGDRDAQR